MKTKAAIVLTALLVGGCGISNYWYTTGPDPVPAAFWNVGGRLLDARDVCYKKRNRQSPIDIANLDGDDRFRACMKEAGFEIRSVEWDDETKQRKLIPND